MAYASILHHQRRLIITSLAIAALVILVIWLFAARSTEGIDSYQECTNAGYPVTDSDPAVCRAGSHYFTGPRTSVAPSVAVTSQPFELLVDADSSSNYPRGWEVITSSGRWQSFWLAIHKTISPTPPIIGVDFTTHDVVALSEGQKPTGGYRVEVTNIATSNSGTVIQIAETSPVGCIEPQHVTNPYYLISTAKLVAPVSYVVSQRTHTCPS